MLISSKYSLDLPDASLFAVRSSARRAAESVSDHLRKKSAEGAGGYRRGERQGHEPLGVSVFVLSPRLEQKAEENRADAHERASWPKRIETGRPFQATGQALNYAILRTVTGLGRSVMAGDGPTPRTLIAPRP